MASCIDDIDESLYSRQLYTLGLDTMRKLARGSVLISGLNGLGAEVAKNVILGGVRSVILHDDHRCEVADLGSNFYLDESSIGRNRAESCYRRFAGLNPNVKVDCSTEKLTEDFVFNFQVVVICGRLVDEDLLKIDDFCHRNGIKFILATTRGLFAQLFCDFGPEFTIVDPSAEEPFTCLVESIDRSKNGTDDHHVTLIDHNSLGFVAGNLAKFSLGALRSSSEGQQVWGPFEVKEAFSKREFALPGCCELPAEDSLVATAVKVPKNLEFKPLRSAIKDPKFMITDYAKLGREKLLHQVFCQHQNGHAPSSEDEAIIREFEKQVNGELCPMSAIMGGFAAQEAFKALTGKFVPLHQFMYFDALESLPEDSTASKLASSPLGTSYDRQIAVYGQEFQKKLESLKLFLVGSGAIGCEMLKNFAMMGVACGGEGKVVVTDMDLIERSNLNRQFLFRGQHIGQPKSVVAAESSRQMNPSLKVEARQQKVGFETECVFNDSFFERLDVVVNALDNRAAREYVDSRCIFFQKPMLESATRGTHGSTKVVIPDLTECYSAEPAAVEASYAQCTIKSFPNAIQHTLHWARDLFQELFVSPAELAGRFVADPQSFIQQVKTKSAADSLEILDAVKKALIDDKPQTFEDCVAWARRKWQSYYSNDIQQLVYRFPREHLTKEGQPFWSVSIRFPNALNFDSSDELHFNFVMAAANLYAEMYGIALNRDRCFVRQIVEQVEVPIFEPNNKALLPTTDEELATYREQFAENNRSRIAQLIAELAKIQLPANGHKLKPTEFEKDDDNNFHMDFVVAASNLRALNYDIEPVDRLTSKLIAGKITPAIERPPPRLLRVWPV